MPNTEKRSGLTVEQYLSGELKSQTKHEFIDGEIFAMAGASANHERISVNIMSELRNHLKGSTCEPFGSDMKVRIQDDFYYPDVLVDCKFDESQPYYTQTPVIIVEVISQSTRKMDEQHKFLRYINIPTLQEYVMIEQDFVDVTVCRRKDGWIAMHYFLGDSVKLESIDMSLQVEEIYLRVYNEDMTRYLEQQSIQKE